MHQVPGEAERFHHVTTLVLHEMPPLHIIGIKQKPLSEHSRECFLDGMECFLGFPLFRYFNVLKTNRALELRSWNLL